MKSVNKASKTKSVKRNTTPKASVKKETVPVEESQSKQSASTTVNGVTFHPFLQMDEFTKCIEDHKFLDMFFDLSKIHWRICRSEDFEGEALDKIKTENYTASSAFYTPLKVRGREYSLFFLSDSESDIKKFLTKSKRLSAFNF